MTNNQENGMPDDWWSLIDRKAALREQFPPADVVRATERVSLGLLHKPPTPEERAARGAWTQERDADLFIARMEERTGAAAAHRHHLQEMAALRAVKRREEWAARMRDKGYDIKDQTA